VTQGSANWTAEVNTYQGTLGSGDAVCQDFASYLASLSPAGFLRYCIFSPDGRDVAVRVVRYDVGSGIEYATVYHRESGGDEVGGRQIVQTAPGSSLVTTGGGGSSSGGGGSAAPAPVAASAPAPGPATGTGPGFAVGSMCFRSDTEAAAAACSAAAGVSGQGSATCSGAQIVGDELQYTLNFATPAYYFAREMRVAVVRCEPRDFEYWAPIAGVWLLAAVTVLAGRQLYQRVFKPHEAA